jgi:hypothetical protein
MRISTGVRRRLTLLLLAIIVLAVGAAVAIIILVGGHVDEALGLLVPSLAFAVVGSLIVLRRPENRMGWIFVAVGWFMSSGTLADEIANQWIRPDAPPSFPALLAVWYSEWFWLPFLFLALGLGILLFPNGRALSPRWAVFARGVVAVGILLAVLAALDPLLGSSAGHEVANPIGISPLGDPDDEPLTFLLLVSILATAVGSMTSIVLRFRRSTGDERQQLKWFTYTALFQVTGFILLGVFEYLDSIPLLAALVFSSLPVGAGIAILRYRLYDIDVVINRTLVYAVLTAVLVGAYALGVLVFRTLLDPVTRDNDLAIAASTLAVAALFGPARRRIQAFIDFRFYRSRYDARHILDDFSARLRDEVDLEALSDDVLRTLGATVKPRHVSLWLPAEMATRNRS